MSNLQETLEGEIALTILFYHKGDSSIARGIDEIQVRSSNGEISDFLINVISGQAVESFWLQNGEMISADLGKEVSRISGIHELKRIDIVSVCSGMLSDLEQSQLSDLLGSEVRELQKLAAGASIVVEDHRVYFPEYGNFGDPKSFLVGDANSRLVVLPLDKARDRAVNQEISFQDLELFASHVSMEILSIAGFWKAQEGTTLEKISQLPVGNDDQSVQIVRSFARTATTSLSELDHVTNSFFSGNLPVPVSKVPAPNPYYLVNYAADKIHHRNFRLRAQRSPDFGKKIEGMELMKRIIGRMWKDFRSIPRILRHGLSSRLKKDIDHVAQEMVGKNSWLQVIQKDENSQNFTIDDEEIETAVNSINSLIEKPENAVVWGDEWNLVLQNTLGVIDGSEEARAIRESAGDERWVAVELDALTPQYSSDIQVVAHSLGVINPSTEGQSEVLEQVEDLSEVPEPVEDQTEESELSEESGDQTNYRLRASVESEPNLIKLITGRFTNETETAKQRFKELMERIQQLKVPEGNENEIASKVIRTLFVSSFFIFLISLFVFSPLHDLFHNGVGQIWRLRLFFLITGPVLLPIMALFAPRDPQKRQIFHVVSFVSIVMLTALGIAFADLLSSAKSKWLGAIIVLAVVIFVIVKVVQLFLRGRRENVADNKIAVRICSILIPIYLLIVIVFTVNNNYYHPPVVPFDKLLNGEIALDEDDWETAKDIANDLRAAGYDAASAAEIGDTQSAANVIDAARKIQGLPQSIEEKVTEAYFKYTGDYFSENQQWFYISFIFALALFLASGAYVSRERQREENAFNDWEAQFRWLTEEAKLTARDLQLIQNYQNQWVGTSLVLARLIRHPHGIPVDGGYLGEINASTPSQAQKLQVISLVPTETGIDAFRQNANSKISEPGWLTTQYRSMVREFQRGQTNQNSGLSDVTALLPENDPYPVSLDNALDGNASGQRWPFCYQVYSGRFDEKLRETAISKLTEALLQTYLEHPNSYVTSSGVENNDDLSKAFSDVLAMEQQLWIPAVFGTDVAVNFQGSQKFSTNVWWPKDLLSQPELDVTNWNSLHNAKTSSSATSIFTQVIRVDISESLVLSSLMPSPVRQQIDQTGMTSPFEDSNGDDSSLPDIG